MTYLDRGYRLFLNHHVFEYIDQIREVVNEAVEFHNTQRPHRSLDMLTPKHTGGKTGQINKSWISYKDKHKKQHKLNFDRKIKEGEPKAKLLVNKIRRQPYSVVLFDEIEKAHQSVYDIFLQIMDEGKLHDRLGKEGDFSNAIVLFTSNVGSDWMSREMSESRIPTTTQLMEVMGQYFRPEFLARLSEIVPFSPIPSFTLRHANIVL